ncbi:MAG: DUF2567 domain-containing protein [Actinomycetota bacterium]|nr:DUF2567 domain-containing protein [Actinomycetota bacterium]
MTHPSPPVRPDDPARPVQPRRAAPIRSAWAPREDVRAAIFLVLVLAVVGALLGVLWQWWSPPGPLGYVVAPNAIQPDETEAFIAGDGRFALICASAGLVAGLVAWLRTSTRGPATALGLGVGGLLGSYLTSVVGHALAGGSDTGKTNTLLPHLPLSVHMRGLFLLEATVAVLVYGVCASFAAEDDLGRPGPTGSVGMWDEMQNVGHHRDAAGVLQQPYLPPQ